MNKPKNMVFIKRKCDSSNGTAYSVQMAANNRNTPDIKTLPHAIYLHLKFIINEFLARTFFYIS